VRASWRTQRRASSCRPRGPGRSRRRPVCA
jgi:hypothetical protein